MIISSVITWEIKEMRDFDQYMLKYRPLEQELQKSWDFEILCVKKGLAKYDKDGNVVLTQ